MRCFLLVLVGLAGCYDFKGELNRLGFSSNLLGEPFEMWTPDHPIAAGTRARFSVTELLDDAPSDALLDVTGRVFVSGLVGEWTADGSQPDHLAVMAPGRARGLVRFEGGVADQFRVEFAPVESADLFDIGEKNCGVEHADIALVPGSSVSLVWPQFFDRRGRTLGFDPEAVSVSGEGALSAWIENGPELAADGVAGQDGAVRIAYADRNVTEVPVVLAGADAVSDMTLHTCSWWNQDHVVVIVAAAWLDDDTRLFGAPVEWSWDGDWTRDTVQIEGRPDMLMLSGFTGSGPRTIRAALGPIRKEISLTP